MGYDADTVDDILAEVMPAYTEPEEFKGDYADDAEKRKGEMPVGTTQERGLREKVLVLDGDEMEDLDDAIRTYRGLNGAMTETPSRIILAICKEWNDAQ